VILGNSWCPHYAKLALLPCPRPPNKSVLLAKFWKLVDDKQLVLQGVDRGRHSPDKRWLLDVLATFTPQDEIFGKGYQPPERDSKLSEIKSIELPADFLKDLPPSRRRSRRKGLRLQKDGLRLQRKERLKMMQRKLANAILDEEVKHDERHSRQRVRTATNEAAFKTPQSPSTPPRTTTQRMSASAITSSSGGQPQASQASEASPGMNVRMDGLSLDSGSKARKRSKD